MFKDTLKDLRTKNNLSQQALADIIFVSRSTIAKWENGLGLPSEANVEQLMNYFNVTHDYLFKEIVEEDVIEMNITTKKKNILYSILSSLTSALVFVLSIVSLTNHFGIVGVRNNGLTIEQIEVPGYCIEIHKNMIFYYEDIDGIKHTYIINGASELPEVKKNIWADFEPFSIEVHERIGFIYYKPIQINQKIILTEKAEGELYPKCGGIINVVKDKENVYHYFYHRPEYSGSSLVYDTPRLTIEANGVAYSLDNDCYFTSEDNLMAADCVISICGVEYNKYIN